MTRWRLIWLPTLFPASLDSDKNGGPLLHLTELSIPRQHVILAAVETDPLVAADLGYAIKTWMASRPNLACRPWRAVSTGETVRIVGWRRVPPCSVESVVFVGAREVRLKSGDALALSAELVPLRRSKNLAWDAAEGREDADIAYTAWLTERLVDLQPFARLERASIVRAAHRQVLRKAFRRNNAKVVRPEVIPVIDATIAITVVEPLGVVDWLARGVGPHKAFGYGAFLPVVINI